MNKNCRMKVFTIMDDSTSGRGIMNINVRNNTQPKITFLMDESNFLYGVDKFGSFCIGVVDEDYNITLFKISRVPKYEAVYYFKGKLSEDFSKFFGESWRMEYGKYLSCALREIKLGEVIVTGELFSKIQDEKRPGIYEFIELKFQEFYEEDKRLPQVLEKLCLSIKDSSSKNIVRQLLPKKDSE